MKDDGDVQRCLRCEKDKEETVTLYRDGRLWATLCIDCHDAISKEVAEPKHPVTDGGQVDGDVDRDPFIHAGEVANDLREIEEIVKRAGGSFDPDATEAAKRVREKRQELERLAWGETRD